MPALKQAVFSIALIAAALSASSVVTAAEKWASEVQSEGDTDGSKWDVLGVFDSYQESSDCSLRWSKAHADSLRLTREIFVGDPGAIKDATTKEHKLGDTIKQYKDEIANAWKRATNAKATLVNTTGQLLVSEFDNVNKQIALFNQQYDAGAAAGWSSEFSKMGVSRVDAIVPDRTRQYTVFVYQQQSGQWVRDDTRSIVSNDLPTVQRYVVQVKAAQGWNATTNAPAANKPASDANVANGSQAVANSITGRWEDTLDSPGEIWEFQQDGRASLNVNDATRSTRWTNGSFSFSWRQEGSLVTVTNPNGFKLFEARIDGDVLSGTGYSETLSGERKRQVEFKKLK